MPFVTPSSVAALQAQVRGERDQIQAAIEACPKLANDAAFLAEWGAESATVEVFLAMEPSWVNTASQMDTGQALQRDLDGWRSRVASSGCQAPPAPSPAPPTPGEQVASAAGALTTLVVVGFGAWALSKVLGR